MAGKVQQITIHLDGRTTDYGLAKELAERCPLSFRKAQDLLVAVSKLIKRSGFFTSDGKRLLRVRTEISGLLHALQMEGLMEEDPLSSCLEFMNIISDTFPNWQKEYAVLNDMLTDES